MDDVADDYGRKHKIMNDIWNSILQQRSIEYWTFREFPETKPVIKDEKKFLECISNYDLPKLYELDRKVHYTILALADYIFFSKRLFDEEYAEEILSMVYSNFPEIAECLDETALVSDIAKAIETPNKYYKNKVFKTPSHLKKLASFYTLVHQKIRNEEVFSWRAKPEAYLKSFSNFCPQFGDEEALLYLWSRDIEEYPLALNQVRDRWKHDIKENLMLECKNIFPESPCVLACRLIDWSMIDFSYPLGESISDLLDDRTDKNNGLVYNVFTIFEMFTSPKCIARSEQLLKKGLKAYEECLQDPLKNKDFSSFEKSSIGVDQVTSIAATYIFGYYRMPSTNLDKNIVELALQYLLDSQNNNGSFGHNHSKKGLAVYQTAICTHTLALSGLERKNCRDSASSAALWLKKQQNDYGIWQFSENDNPVPLTVMVMDSIDLAEGSSTTIADIDIPRISQKETLINICINAEVLNGWRTHGLPIMPPVPDSFHTFPHTRLGLHYPVKHVCVYDYKTPRCN